MYPEIYTKWGIAKVRDGYYRVGNKSLHRLIYEDNNNCTLLPTTHIHHINRNKLDNSIENLVALTPKEHIREHKRIRDQQYEEERKKMLNGKVQIFRKGFPRIVVRRNGEYSYLFCFYYPFQETPGPAMKYGQIINKDIEELKKIVLQEGLSWNFQTSKNLPQD